MWVDMRRALGRVVKRTKHRTLCTMSYSPSYRGTHEEWLWFGNKGSPEPRQLWQKVHLEVDGRGLVCVDGGTSCLGLARRGTQGWVLLFLYPGQVLVFNLTKKKKIPGTGSCVSLLPKPPECWDCRCMLPRTTQIVLKWGERLSDCTCDQDDSGSRWRTDGRRCERTGGLHKARRGKGEGEEGVLDSHLKGWVGRGSLLIPPAVAGGGGR